MGGSNFDLLVQEIFKHKRIMEQLEEENRELRRQIADLREGRGIFIEICGKRFALIADTASMQPIRVPAPVGYTMSAPLTPPVPVLEASPSQKGGAFHTEVPDVTESPTIAMPETPTSPIRRVEDEEEEDVTPTFLEEIMIDEFSSASAASTNSLAVWSPPAKEQQTDEDEKAALRRQLIGSFLLE